MKYTLKKPNKANKKYRCYERQSKNKKQLLCPSETQERFTQGNPEIQQKNCEFNADP